MRQRNFLQLCGFPESDAKGWSVCDGGSDRRFCDFGQLRLDSLASQVIQCVELWGGQIYFLLGWNSNIDEDPISYCALIGECMKRAMVISLSLVVFGWIAGCGSYNPGGGGGGGNTPNALKGQYAILLGGVDKNFNQISIAGSLTANGLGTITGGEVDVSDNGTAVMGTSLAGTYSFDANGSGTLGKITLTSTVTGLQPLGFYFSLQTSGDFGQIMSNDANLFTAAGTIQKQSTPILTQAGMAGDYIVTMDGRGELNPTSVLGRFSLDSAGAGSNTAFDRSIALSTTGSAPASSATVSFGAPDANGRGTLNLTITDAFAATPQTFAYYAITNKRTIAVETDATGSMLADFSAQSTPFTNSSVATAGSVFGMAGVDSAVAGGSDIAAVGQLVITGAGPTTTGTINWDSNDGGIIVGPASSAGETVGFNSLTGRGTITIANGVTKGIVNPAVFYLTAPGTGFIMDATAGPTNRAMTGILTAQTTAPGSFSVATDFPGVSIVRSRGASGNDVYSFVGVFGLTTVPGTYALVLDDGGLIDNSGNVKTEQDVSCSSFTLGTVDANVGRGTFVIPCLAGNDTNTFYAIGPNQFMYIDTSPAGTPFNGESTLFIASPR
jgi:hypothetical protein